jgi:selenocysteine lyase/cysteine desulfurase
VLVTHVSNLTGQLFPVRRIAAAAHRVGAEVVVDGAQSLGVLGEPVPALDCDYYGASAHKWLGTPVGLGVLWMRPAHVEKIWPTVPPPPDVTGMRRFEWVGTAPAYLWPASLPALALHRSLGPARKAARLRHLGSLLRKRVTAALPGARFYTPADSAMSIGITTIEVPDLSSDDLQKRLRERYRILTQSMAGNKRAPEIRGLRITPNVYTTSAELDRLVAALKAG